MQRPLPSSSAALHAVFFVSGCCGLIYESIWTHYLKLFLGHAAFAQTVVLTVFIGGMALGAWLAGRWSRRLRSPLMAYAAAEIAIGFAALGFHRMFESITGMAYTTLLPQWCGAGEGCTAHWLIGAAMILPQSILLGTTFPLMVAGILRRQPALAGRRISILYCLNSLGAVLGVLAASFLLVPEFGLPGTLLVAGLCNVAVAIAAWLIASRGDDEPAPAVGMMAGDPALPAEARWLLLLSAVTGATSFAYEIVWIRMLSLVLGSSTHAFEIMLASFIFGLAAGSWLVSRRIERWRHLVGMLAGIQVAMGVFAVLTLGLYNSLFGAMHWVMQVLSPTEEGYRIYHLASTLFAMSIMVPATLCAGMTLPIVSYRLLQLRVGERSLGQVYALNTIGAIAGVALTLHFALPMLGLQGSLVLAAAGDMVAGVLLFAWLARTQAGWSPVAAPRARIPAATAGALVSVVAVAWALLAVDFDVRKTASGVFRHSRASIPASSDVVFEHDGKAATVYLVRHADGQLALSTNGKVDGMVQMDARGRPTQDEATMTLLGALPLAVHPQARTAAVIGFGTGMTSATMLADDRLERLDTIEIEAGMVRAARHFGEHSDAAFSDRRSRILIDDAKSYFARAGQRYDLIVSEPSNPWVSGVASLFTREFYERVAATLNPDGVFVQWLQIYESHPVLVHAILKALRTQFPAFDVYASTYGDLIVVATRDGRPRGVDASIFAAPAMRSRLQRVGVADVEDLRLRRLASESSLMALLSRHPAAISSDYFPVVDDLAPKYRFMRQSALDLFTLRDASVPVAEVIDRWSPGSAGFATRDGSSGLPAERSALRTARIVRFVTDGEAAGSELLGDGALAPMAAELRAALVTCRASDWQVPVVEAAASVAAQVNPWLAPAQADRFWRVLTESSCARRLPAGERRWIDLYAAIGRRDWPAVAVLSETLLGEVITTGPLPIEQAVLGGTVARLASGDAEQAMRFFDRHALKVPQDRLQLAGFQSLAAHLVALSDAAAAVGAPVKVGVR